MSDEDVLHGEILPSEADEQRAKEVFIAAGEFMQKSLEDAMLWGENGAPKPEGPHNVTPQYPALTEGE